MIYAIFTTESVLFQSRHAWVSRTFLAPRPFLVARSGIDAATQKAKMIEAAQ